MAEDANINPNPPPPPSACSVTDRLKQVLIEWRAAEKAHAYSVLCASHPDRIRELADAMERALHHVRLNVDTEPWAEIAFNEFSPNTETTGSPPLPGPNLLGCPCCGSPGRIVWEDGHESYAECSNPNCMLRTSRSFIPRFLWNKRVGSDVPCGRTA